MPAASIARTPRLALVSVALAAVALVGLAPGGLARPQAATASACAGASAHLSQSSYVAVRDTTLCLLNRERARRGLGRLRLNSRLSLAAARHSRAMVRRRFFAHGSFLARIRRTGYLRSARSWSVGENIAWGSGSRGTPVGIVRAWMASPPHRRNILSRFREVGIGVQVGAPVGGVGDAATYTTNFGRRR